MFLSSCLHSFPWFSSLYSWISWKWFFPIGYSAKCRIHWDDCLFLASLSTSKYFSMMIPYLFPWYVVKKKKAICIFFSISIFPWLSQSRFPIAFRDSSRIGPSFPNHFTWASHGFSIFSSMFPHFPIDFPIMFIMFPIMFTAFPPFAHHFPVDFHHFSHDFAMSEGRRDPRPPPSMHFADTGLDASSGPPGGAPPWFRLGGV